MCDIVNVPNEAWGRVNDELDRAEGRLRDAKFTIAQRAVIVAAEGAREANALQAKLRAEAAPAQLNVAQAAVQAAYDVEKAKHDAQLAVTQAAREKVVALRAEIERFRNRIVNLDAIRTEIAKLVAQSNVLSAYSRNWEKGLDVAGAKYIEAGLDAGRKMANKESGLLDVYKRWLTCDGGAFTPVPYQLGEFGCAAEDYYKQVHDKVRGFVLRNLPEPFRSLYERYGDIRALIQQRIDAEAQRAVIELAKLASPDDSTDLFIELLIDPQSANAAKLREAYAQVGDADGKALLTFPDITQQIDSDIGLTNGMLVPQRFYAMDYALRLSKLALLDQAGMRRLVWRLGGDPNRVGGGGAGRWSILTQSLRSIDGNQQWQSYGIPYARSNMPPEPADPEKRRYGWGPADAAGGLSLFVDPNLRTTVFSRIFPNPIAGAIAARPELSPQAFSFSSCAANPFPVTFAPNGTPVTADNRCAQPNSERRHAASFGLKLKRFFRSIIGALGFGPK